MLVRQGELDLIDLPTHPAANMRFFEIAITGFPAVEFRYVPKLSGYFS